ncbi:MAG: 1,3-propanediol dehydrogenase [Planctomycetota bacterium]|jgi:alcohol dehydrogenase
MQSFDFQQRTRFVYGPGSLQRLGELAKQLGASKVLVVSDQGVVAAGHFTKAVVALEEAGLEVSSFHDFRENPNTEHVDRGVVAARQFQPDLLVGLGGGSSMDCAKGINFLYCCGGRIQDYWGIGKATKELLPMIAVPTTAGTGSEAQSFALISDAQTHVKMACGDWKAACRIALLDPELTLTQPERVTALTGIDAITHALETFVTKRRNPMSICFSREAWRRLARGFGKVLQNPGDLEARGEMQLGAAFAGMAIEASMLGAAHACANPLTAQFGVTHGQAVGLMMPHVIRFNGTQCDTLYGELIRDVQGDLGSLTQGEATERLASLVAQWTVKAGLQTSLRGLKIESKDIPNLAVDATKQWTGSFNPLPVSLHDFERLYENAL